VLEQHLAGREFIVGSRFTAADILVAGILSWSNSMELLTGFPALQAYMGRHMERPAARRAHAD
jgi:glutathione S-transferase